MANQFLLSSICDQSYLETIKAKLRYSHSVQKLGCELLYISLSRIAYAKKKINDLFHYI